MEGIIAVLNETVSELEDLSKRHCFFFFLQEYALSVVTCGYISFKAPSISLLTAANI